MRAVDCAQPGDQRRGMTRPRYHAGLPPDREPELLEAIARLTEERGHCPSFTELGDEMNVSRQRIAKMVASAVERGVLSKEPRRPRTLRLVG
jgi:Mn-dependent DtxR family transcriptional regulator